MKYIPGSTNQLVDCLSWLCGQEDIIKLPKLHVHQIKIQLQARSDSLKEMRIAMQEDDELAPPEACNYPWMAKQHQRSAKWDTSLLDT